MGTGTISTFLGTLPLAFSSNVIFRTIFVAFLGLVLLGASHGLILLPVLLSIFGPEEQVNLSHKGNTSLHTVGENNSKVVDEQQTTTGTSTDSEPESNVNYRGDENS